MLLQVTNITKSYKIKVDNKWFKQPKQILHNISLQLKEGSCLGLIGESGSGKSTLSRVLLGIEQPDSGEFYINGINFWAVSNQERRRLRRKFSIVFQDYISSVNPNFTVEKIILEALYSTQLSVSKKRLRVKELLQKVELSEKFLHRYPHELSGGQLQRVAIARSLANNPQFIILDEAISALDASTQLIVLDLLKKLQLELGLTYIFITHDLMSVTYLCDQVYFLKDGSIIEVVEDIKELGQVQHPYAQALLQAVLPIYSTQRGSIDANL